MSVIALIYLTYIKIIVLAEEITIIDLARNLHQSNNQNKQTKQEEC